MLFRRKLVSTPAGALFEEYCSESSIHGVRFFVGSERSPWVKIAWVAVFVLSLVGCGIMIRQAYDKWERTPVIVTLSEVPTPVWDMTFPAITICPEIKVSKERFNFTQHFDALFADWHNAGNDPNHTISVSEENIGKVKAIAQYCPGIYKSEENFLFSFNHVPEPELVAFLKSVALDRRNVFTMCGSTSDRRCTNYMQVSLTNEGVCYSFNMISEAEMFHEDVLNGEYQHLERWDSARGEAPPTELLRVAGSGLDAAVGFNLLHYPLKIDTGCVRGRGYRILLHEPTVYPDLSKRHIRLPVSYSLTVAVKPNIMQTSPELAKYSASKRQCYFDHEHPLRFFRRYNQDNCERECLTNFTLHRCGCVHFSMPHVNGTEICKLPQTSCAADARAQLFIRKQARNDSNDYLQQCDCLPSCSSVRYDLQVTQNSHGEEKDFRETLMTEMELQAYLTLPAYSVLTVYFQDTHFIPAQRSELHGLVDFLANCGGLLGLFIGVSLLSVVEALYYCAVRPFSLRKRQQPETEP